MNTVVRLRPTTRRLLDLLAKRNRWTLTEAAAYCVERATGVVCDDATSATSTSENQNPSDPAAKAVDSDLTSAGAVAADPCAFSTSAMDGAANAARRQDAATFEISSNGDGPRS